MTTKKTKKKQPVASDTVSETTKPDQDLQDFNRLTEKAHKGFWNAAEALCEIKSRKLYLCRKDENGKTCFRTFDDFLNAEYGFGRSNFCRMSNAYQTYKLLNEKYGESQPALLKAIPENVDTFYEISMIPSDQMDSAISDFATKVADHTPITASLIRKWRTEHQPQSHCELPDLAVPPEAVEEEPPAVTTDADTVQKEDGNPVEATQDDVKPDKNTTSSATTTTVKRSNDTTETKAQDGAETEKEEEDDDDDDDDVVAKIRKIADSLKSDRFIEYFAKDKTNYDWLLKIVKEVGERVSEYIGPTEREN